MELSALERALLAEGKRLICGCDEAGRGALAGPVVAAAVVLDYDCLPGGLNDSKLLRADAREAAAETIRRCAIAWAVCAMSPREIERINILQASLSAMQTAVSMLSCCPEYVLIDGPQLPRMQTSAGGEALDSGSLPMQAIIDGDALILGIAAASILAKVERDRLMRELALEHPAYGFERHMGYGTPQHRAALTAHGPCEIHRRSFKPVQEILQGSLFENG